MNKKAVPNHLINLLLLLVLFLTIFSSCYKEYDFDKELRPAQWNPQLAVPIGSAKLSLSDILKKEGDNEFLHQDPDGFLTVYYQSSLLSEYAGDLIKFGNQHEDTTISILFPINLPVGDSLTLSYMFGQKFSNSYDDVVDSIRFREGTMSFTVESMLEHDAKLVITSPFITRNNIPLRKVINLPYTGSVPVMVTVPVDLEGYTFVFNHAGSGNYLKFFMDVRLFGDTHTNIGPFDLKVSVDQTDLKYRSMFGLIKTRSMALLNDVIQIDLFKKGIGGTFRINDPRIGLLFRNSFGVPVSVAVDPINGHSDVNPPYDVQLSGPGLPVPFLLNAPTYSQVGQSVNTNLSLSKSNSNIDDFVNLQPQQIQYAVEGVINPAGTVPQNFVMDTSHFEVEVEVEIPLEGYAKGFTLQDTLDFNFEDDIDIENIDMIDWILFRVQAESTFPVEAAIQVLFLDSNYLPVDSLFDEPTAIVPGAIPGPPPLYKTDHPTLKTYDIKITSPKIRKLKYDVQFFTLTGRINTAGGATQVVRIYADQYLKLKLGIQTQLKINPNA